MTIIIFFIILLVLVLVHEAGHFFAAKISKMRVDEFAFGFPPRLFSIKKGETEYSLNLLPLGGYVKIYGENGIDESNDSRAFSNAPKIKQIFVLVAGVLMNIVLAFILLSATFFVGVQIGHSTFTEEKYFSNNKVLVTAVSQDSPAEKAGIKQLDQIVSLSVGEVKILPAKPEDVSDFVKNHQEEPIVISTKQKNGQEAEYSVIPVYNELAGKKIIGLSTDSVGTYKAPFLTSIKNGFTATYLYTKLTFLGFADLLSKLFSGHAKEAGSSLTGPVGIVSLVGSARNDGLGALLGFVALISINLAVLNILPLPALDGGRILFVIIEAIRRKKLSENFQIIVNGASFVLLIALMLFVTYRDIISLW